MVTGRLKVLNTGNLVIMTLKGFETFEFLFFVQFPKLNGHISSTTSHALPIRREIYVVDHARMLSQSLFYFSSFRVPKLDRGILTRGCKLIVKWVENTLGYSCTMSHHFELIWLSWNCITWALFNVFLTWSCGILFPNSSIYTKLFFHILHIDLVLLVYFL